LKDDLLDRMRARLREIHARAAIQKWNYRQRNHAAGVWFRLRRVLADAKDAYVISPEDAATLIAEGYVAEPVGAELSPEKTLIFADGDRIDRLVSKNPILVRLSPDFLTSPAVALVPFDPARVKHSPKQK
jgi:hypothetical protein